LVDYIKPMIKDLFIRIFNFYFHGFRNMSKSSRNLWIIILIKLFIMFVIIKFLFMPDFLAKKFDTDAERGQFVLEQLSN